MTGRSRARRQPGRSTMRLKGKIALITAAASGIGRAAAVLFAREGAAVAVADIDKGRISDTLAEIAPGGRGHGLPATSPGTPTAGASCARRWTPSVGSTSCGTTSGTRDRAGRGHAHGRLRHGDDLNVRSVVITTSEAIRDARAAAGASSSPAPSPIYGSPFSPVYSAAKFGVTGLTKSSLRSRPPTRSGSTACARPRSTRRCSTSSWAGPTWKRTSTRTWPA